MRNNGAAYRLVATLMLGALVTAGATSAHRLARASDTVPTLTDAAYRDGLFQGRLAAERGAAGRPSVGRWSGDEERAHFTRGYQQGYLRTAVSPSPTIRLVVAAAGNTARYLVQEQLVGVTLPGQAVGETSAITGAITIDSGGNVVAGASKIVVGVAGLKSDRDRRDGYVRGRILEADRYPTVELVPTALHGLTAPLPTSGSDTLTLVGALTIHGVTRPTSWRIVAGFHGAQITGTASTGFSFADFGLTRPRVPVVLSVADTIRLEYDFTLQRQSDGS